MSHVVTCGDYGHFQDPEEEWEVTGFASAAAATEYARRFIRAQLEDLREGAADEAELRAQYYRWGEYAWTEGFDHKAWVDHCIANPATRRADTDYDALEPRPGR